MPSKNKVSLIGRVGGAPEFTVLTNGTKVCNFSLATNERYVNKTSGEWEDAEPDWHRIVVWGARAESTAKNVSKGDLVGVEGRLRVRTYMKGEVKLTSVQIVSEELLYLKKYEPGEAHERLTAAAAEAQDDLPF